MGQERIKTEGTIHADIDIDVSIIIILFFCVLVFLGEGGERKKKK